VHAVFAHRIPSQLLRACLPLGFIALIQGAAYGQTVTPVSAHRASPPGLDRSAPAWTLKTKQDIRWQQVTPAGTLLVSTDGSLSAVDFER